MSEPIVFVINSLMRGGAQRLVVDDINECVRRGLDVHLVTIEPERVGDSMAMELMLPKERWHFIPVRRVLDVSGYMKLFLFYRHLHPRAVFTHLMLSTIAGRVASIVARVPVIVAFDHNVHEGRKRHWEYAIDRVLSWGSRTIVAVSDAVKESLLKHGISSKKIMVIKNGLDLQRYAKQDVPALRSSIGVEENAFVFLCVARLIHQKGIDILFQALSSVPMATLVVVGDGADRLLLEGLRQKLGLESRVHMLGTRQDIPQLLSMADVFVLPSRWEGLPIALLEAMAAGKPIVASEVDGTREVLVHEVNGLRVSSGDVEALARAMQRVMQDDDLRNRLGFAARQSVQPYGIGPHVDALLRLCA